MTLNEIMVMFENKLSAIMAPLPDTDSEECAIPMVFCESMRTFNDMVFIEYNDALLKTLQRSGCEK